MKSLAELGISPTPWTTYKCQMSDDIVCEVRDVNGRPIIDTLDLSDYEQSQANCDFISAVPELYEACSWCLKQANDIGAATLNGSVNMQALAISMVGIVRRCEKALAKASGEEV